MFEVGQRIVCIDDKFPGTSMDQLIRYDEIYTVRWIGPVQHYIDGEYIGVRLQEIDRGEDPAGYAEPDLPYHSRRFKPLVLPKSKLTKRVSEDV